MSGIGNSWPDDDMDWSFGDAGASQQPTGIIPLAVAPPQIPSLIPVPPAQDQSAAMMSPSAYAPAPALQDPNAGLPVDGGATRVQNIAKALDWAGYFPEGAADFARNIGRLGGADRDVLKALDKTTPYLTGPLAVGSAIAGTISDLQQGTSPADAIVGNIVRGGLVYGAGAGAGELTGGILAIPASMAADHYLPRHPRSVTPSCRESSIRPCRIYIPLTIPHRWKRSANE